KLELVLAATGTIAWNVFQDQKLNRLKSSTVLKGSVSASENFIKTPIRTNGTTTKEVSVTNASDAQHFIRASFEEVMRHLKSQGVEKAVAQGVDYDPATANLEDDLPVAVEGATADLTSQGYTKIPDAKITGFPNVPSGAKGKNELWVKGSAKG